MAVGSAGLPGGSGLPNGDQLSFHVLSGLQFWNGSSFGAVPAGETLNLISQRDPNLMTAVSPGAPGFVIGTVGGLNYGNQGVHEHLSSVLSRPGNAIPTDGIYMFEMDLTMTNDSNVATSLPFVVLYNHLANRFDLDEPNDDPQVQAAIGYAGTLVPEPSSAVWPRLE